jgi:hypothetical protein
MRKISKCKAVFLNINNCPNLKKFNFFTTLNLFRYTVALLNVINFTKIVLSPIFFNVTMTRTKFAPTHYWVVTRRLRNPSVKPVLCILIC